MVQGAVHQIIQVVAQEFLQAQFEAIVTAGPLVGQRVGYIIALVYV